MTIGTGVVLFVIGAILKFAIHLPNSFVDLNLIGYILMGAGVVVFIIGLIVMFRRRSTTTTVQSGVDAQGRQVTERRTSVSPDDPQ